MKNTESDIYELNMGDMLLTIIDGNAPTGTPVILPHFHPFIELQYIVKGSAYIKCLDQKFEVPEGHVAIVPPNVFHDTAFKDEWCKRYVVMLSVAPNEKAENKTGEFSYYNKIFSSVENVIVFQNPMISRCVENILDDLTKNDDSVLFNLKVYFAMIVMKAAEEITKIGLCEKNTQAGCCSDNKSDIKIRNAIGNFVISNYQKSDVTQELADHLNMSVRNTSRIVKKLFGVTLGTLVVNQRMYLARTYIAQTDMSVQKISELAGYNDYSTFFRTFKKYFGISPELIRKNCSHNDKR